jgi:hypothetical protein
MEELSITSAQSADELARARENLSKKGYEWVKVPKMRGRPQVPLYPGQQLYIEAAYSAGKAQTRIATIVGVAPPRIRRHLQAKGLLIPRRTSHDLELLLMKAAEMYIGGDQVQDILDKTGVTTPDLYRTLRQMEIPLRHVNHNSSQSSSQGGGHDNSSNGYD